MALDRNIHSLQSMMNATWEQVAHEFAPDGALRDIYVHQTDLADWDAMFEMLRQRYAPLVFTRDGERVPLPARVEEVFAHRNDASLALDFEVAGIELACHFFTPEEIEFDLPPEHIDSAERFEALQTFLRAMASTLGKPVSVTPENLPEVPILTVDPRTERVIYHEEPDAPAI